jgi:Fasciclin domain/Domain of unknown function (DUF4397)
MRWTRLFALLTLIVLVLAACGGAPALQSSSHTAAPAASSGAPTVGTAPTAAAGPTAQASAVTDHPNDATQARLRLALFVFGGPNVDLFVNGQVAVNGGQAQANLPAGYINGYLYLPPGTYSVAVVPTGKGIDQALLGPLDVPLAAGHRYTLVMMGQQKDPHVRPLVIDETAAELKVGAAPTDVVVITVNNLAGAAGIDVQWAGKMVTKNTPFGGFDVAIHQAGNYPVKVTVSGDTQGTLITDNTDWNEPGASFLGGFAGQYPGNWHDYGSALTSELNTIDFLKGFSGMHLQMDGRAVSFDTLLAAIKTAGLTELLTTGGPYALFAPTDDAFATMPKDQRDTLLADPKALADLLRAHISQGYYPSYSFSKTPGQPWDRTITNLLGAKMVLGDGTINGAAVGDISSTIVANGIRVSPITKVLLPAAK